MVSKTDPTAGTKITKSQTVTLYIVQDNSTTTPSRPTGPGGIIGG
jgi:hypothetical protein